MMILVPLSNKALEASTASRSFAKRGCLDIGANRLRLGRELKETSPDHHASRLPFAMQLSCQHPIPIAGSQTTAL